MYFKTYFWQIILAGASLYALSEGVRIENKICWLMAVPFLMACWSIWIIKKHNYDLNSFFAKRTIMAVIDAVVIGGTALIEPFLLLSLLTSYIAPILLVIMLYINVRYFIAKCDDFYACLALTLADPLHFCISIVLVIYFSVYFY